MYKRQGQGNTLVSPMHMALITSAIANGGELMKPYLIDSVVSSDGETVKTTDEEVAVNKEAKQKETAETETVKKETTAKKPAARRTRKTAEKKSAEAEKETEKKETAKDVYKRQTYVFLAPPSAVLILTDFTLDFHILLDLLCE